MHATGAQPMKSVDANGSMDGDEAVKALVVKVLWFFREYKCTLGVVVDGGEEVKLLGP